MHFLPIKIITLKMYIVSLIVSLKYQSIAIAYVMVVGISSGFSNGPSVCDRNELQVVADLGHSTHFHECDLGSDISFHAAFPCILFCIVVFCLVILVYFIFVFI